MSGWMVESPTTDETTPAHYVPYGTPIGPDGHGGARFRAVCGAAVLPLWTADRTERLAGRTKCAECTRVAQVLETRSGVK